MLYRRLGRTGFQASVVGFGGIPIMRRPRPDAVEILRRALELGVNYIDTARNYRDSEDKVGEAVRGWRDRVFITTKSHFKTKAEVAESIDESLRRFALDWVDAVLMHGVDSDEDLESRSQGPLEAIKGARAAGKVRYIGLSGHRNAVLCRALRTGAFDLVLASYNLTNDDADRELFPLAQELDVGITVMKPIGGGALGVPPEALQFHVEDKAVSTAEAALRFALSNSSVASVCVGMGRLSEVEANVALGAIPQAMPRAEYGALSERAKTLGFTFCQGCGYCLPNCPEKINIQEVFRLLAFHDQYGMTGYAKAVFRAWHEQAAAKCTECSACTERCPASLGIPELLREARLKLGAKDQEYD